MSVKIERFKGEIGGDDISMGRCVTDLTVTSDGNSGEMKTFCPIKKEEIEIFLFGDVAECREGACKNWTLWA